MKGKLTILVWVVVFLLGHAHAKEINMLFMGNSFTFRHDLPELVKQVFEEGQPNLTVNVERIVYGGQDLFRHHDLYFSETFVRLHSITVSEAEEKIIAIQSLLAAGESPIFYRAYWEKTSLKPPDWSTIEKNLQSAQKRQQQLIERIKAGDRIKWDYLVLQSWRDVVENVNAGYAEYAQKWAKMAQEEGIKVILYITAPHAQNAEPVTEPVGLEQTEMEMETIHKLVDRIHPFAVVPVALGLKRIQRNGTDLTFRYVNDMHPNQYAAFLTSNMFYAAFFKETTEGLHYNSVTETNPKGQGPGKDPDGGNATVTFDATSKILLQRAAYDAAMEFYAEKSIETVKAVSFATTSCFTMKNAL
ncbi:hypothetical protein ACFL6U_03365 [Planctomycetota bacterium]